MNDATQSSQRITAAMGQLQKVRWDDKFYGSGVIVTVTDLGGNVLMSPVAIGGEFTKPLQDALINALEVAAENRLQLLNLQTSDLRAALHKSRGLTK